jgi:hypothetical protein
MNIRLVVGIAVVVLIGGVAYLVLNSLTWVGDKPVVISHETESGGKNTRLTTNGDASVPHGNGPSGNTTQYGQVLTSDTPDEAKPDNSPDDGTPEASTFEEEFIRRFSELASAENWNALEKHVHRSIVNAPSLKDFLPVLLAALEGIADRVGYYPVGRGVQTGMYLRSDLIEHRDEIANEFFAASSPLIQSLLAPALGKAFHGSENPSHITTYIEGLLTYHERERARHELAALSSLEYHQYITALLGVHQRLWPSVLDSIKFVEDGLGADALDDSIMRAYWRDISNAFHHKRYSNADVPEIVVRLIAHTDQGIRARNGSQAEINRLKSIWERLREPYVYREGLRHAEASSDALIRDSYDQILVHWLEKNGGDGD